MSKKSRRRNRRLLALAALAGGAALAGRGKGTGGGGFLKSGAAGGASLADLAEPSAVTGVVNPNAAKAAVVDAAPAITGVQEGNTRLKRDGVTPGMILNERRNTPGYGTAVAPPGILNPYRAPRQKLRTFKSGGSVKKARVTGIAKRGFGRALMKGKK